MTTLTVALRLNLKCLRLKINLAGYWIQLVFKGDHKSIDCIFSGGAVVCTQYTHIGGGESGHGRGWAGGADVIIGGEIKKREITCINLTIARAAPHHNLKVLFSP